MKRLALLLVPLALHAEGRWFELRCSPSHPSTNYVIPVGKVFQIMAWDAPERSATFTAVRPEGTVSNANVSSDLSTGSYIMGPGTVTFFWTGQIAPNIGYHLLTCREFDAEGAPPVRVALEVSTNLPAFTPAATLFRAKTE